MDMIRVIIILSMVLFLCVHENPDEEISYPGMVEIKSSSQTAILGSSKSSALIDEKPQFTVKFSYNYYIDTVEVTIGMYRALMGKIPKEYDTVVADSMSPVCFVSWFDALMFCNERSKHENLDTVYSYLAIDKTEAGDIYRMVGLRTEFNKNGYRLPTEAEWVFAARGSQNIEYFWGDDPVPEMANVCAWYNGNSQRKPHVVATLAPNMHGLYDMAGNVSEWVNDSKKMFNGSEMVDFAGGIEDGSSARVLKGGSYELDITNLRIPCRSDLYPVDVVSRNRYTGFRCVAGTIKNKPTYLTNNNQLDNLEPVTIVNSSLLPVTGSNNARLVFVNKSGIGTRTLCYVDYARQPVALYQFPDQTDVHNPVISPDGAWVSWSTDDEGAIMEGKVIVRKLDYAMSDPVVLPDTPAFIPRWYVDPATTDTFVIYVTSAQPNDQSSWKSSQTRMILFENGCFYGPPVVLESSGSYHGGRSVNGEFIATGYTYLKMKNLATQEEKTLFYAPLDGKKGNDTSQVCNVSISPAAAAPNHVLFLDFGTGRDISNLTQTVYGSHEYIFMADFNGAVLKTYRVPPPFYAWNHVEWSNRHRYAVSTVTTSNGTNRLVYCIDLQTSAYTPLWEGTDLYHPYLWISPGSDTLSTDLSLDSIGQYDNVHLAYQQSWIALKLRLFWNHAQSLDAIVLGTSTATDGINPSVFKDFKAINMGIPAGELETSIELIDHYVLNHCSRLKVIVLCYDPHVFFKKTEECVAYQTFTQSKGYIYDKNNLFWKDGIPDQFNTLINSVPVRLLEESPGLKTTDSLGFTPCMCSGWGNTLIQKKLDDTRENGTYRLHMNMLLNTVMECSSRGIKVLLVNLPVHPGYVNTDAFGVFGPSRTVAKEMIAEILDEAAKDSNLVFYDANNDGRHDYNEFEFADCLHLCENGAKKLSTRVDSILHVIVE